MSTVNEIEFIFEPDPDGGYHAYVPELPGLHSEGDTLEGALTNAQEALDLYVEGLREEGRRPERATPIFGFRDYSLHPLQGSPTYPTGTFSGATERQEARVARSYGILSTVCG